MYASLRWPISLGKHAHGSRGSSPAMSGRNTCPLQLVRHSSCLAVKRTRVSDYPFGHLESARLNGRPASARLPPVDRPRCGAGPASPGRWLANRPRAGGTAPRWPTMGPVRLTVAFAMDEEERSRQTPASHGTGEPASGPVSVALSGERSSAPDGGGARRRSVESHGGCCTKPGLRPVRLRPSRDGTELPRG
jgi:hypothetical protein